MEVYAFSNILEINKKGLTYIDSTGSRKAISFNECRKSWVKHVNESGKLIFLTVTLLKILRKMVQIV